MKRLILLFVICIFIRCESPQKEMKKILFLHHSTGMNVWLGNTNRYLYKLTRKGAIQKFFTEYNNENKSNYELTELYFPKEAPYGWNNYPYDYYNIWVKNAGENTYKDEPTLEILTKKYDVIIFKHCFPGSRISEDTGSPDINSDAKRVENYKLQYNALKQKMHEFRNTKFIVWTPAVCTKNQMTADEADRTYQFYKWMTDEWDEDDDNIFIWDFYKYETEGGLYMLDKNARSPDDPHPSVEFSARVAPLFCNYILDVIKSHTER